MFDEKEAILQGDATVVEVLNTFPQTVSFFLQNQLGCIGCSMAPFCTLLDVSDYYILDLDTLLRELSALTPKPG